jgi:hypothetical protein
MCHAHHLTHWIDGGTTALHNLILLCGHHHRLLHTGPWHLEATAPGRFHFVPPAAVTRHRTTRAPPRE